MQSEFAYRGRQVSAAEIEGIRQLIAAHPELSRWRLSFKLCEAWNWVQPNGQPRAMLARSLMLQLHRAGHIQLPAQCPIRWTSSLWSAACCRAPCHKAWRR